MSDAGTAIPRSNGSRLAQLPHYILALVTLVTVSASLWLSNSLVRDFQSALDEYEEWAEYVAESSSLADDLA